MHAWIARKTISIFWWNIWSKKKMKKRNAGKLKIKSEARTRNHTVDKKNWTSNELLLFHKLLVLRSSMLDQGRYELRFMIIYMRTTLGTGIWSLLTCMFGQRSKSNYHSSLQVLPIQYIWWFVCLIVTSKNKKRIRISKA